MTTFDSLSKKKTVPTTYDSSRLCNVDNWRQFLKNLKTKTYFLNHHIDERLMYGTVMAFRCCR